METTKRQYVLEGLCCGDCAAKIQNDIRLLDGVKNADVNADTTVLSVEFDADTEALIKDITRIAVFYDEDIVIREI